MFLGFGLITFYTIVSIIVWIFLSHAVGLYAKNKGFSYLSFVLLGLFLSPVTSFMFAFLYPENLKKIEEMKLDSGEYKRCDDCCELIRNSAIVCKHCGSLYESDEDYQHSDIEDHDPLMDFKI